MRKKIKWPSRGLDGKRIAGRSEVHKYPSSGKKFLPVEIEDFATKKPLKLARLRQELNEHKKRLEAIPEIMVFLAKDERKSKERKALRESRKGLIERIEKDPSSFMYNRYEINAWKEQLSKKTPEELNSEMLRNKERHANSKRILAGAAVGGGVQYKVYNLAESIVMRKLINEEIAKRKRG